MGKFLYLKCLSCFHIQIYFFKSIENTTVTDNWKIEKNSPLLQSNKILRSWWSYVCSKRLKKKIPRRKMWRYSTFFDILSNLKTFFNRFQTMVYFTSYLYQIPGNGIIYFMTCKLLRILKLNFFLNFILKKCKIRRKKLPCVCKKIGHSDILCTTEM